MKTLLYLLTALMLTVSCRSVEKLVDQGRYDDAIYLAADRLSGKKNKKTKHVKALEEAFWKITDLDMAHIKQLDAKHNPHYWKDVLATIEKIERRQSRITAFLPLVSKDGYKADFRFVRTAELKNEALDGAAAYHYNRAQAMLKKAIDMDDRFWARSAFSEFGKVSHYRPAFRDSEDLRLESRERGITHILLEFDTGSFNYFEKQWLTNAMADRTAHRMDGFWQRYHLELDREKADYIASVELRDILVSPEREIIHHHNDRKKVKDGWEYVKSKDGEIKTDSLGNKLRRDVYRNINARITEVFREKSALVSSELRLVDLRTGKLLDRRMLKAETFFEDVAVRFRGDRRAVCDKDINRLKDFSLPFPEDMEMLLSATDILATQLESELRRNEI